MNGASGFQEVWSSTSRSPTNRVLHEQQHRFGTDTWHRFRTMEWPRMAPILPRDPMQGRFSNDG